MERNSPISEFIMSPICQKIFNKIDINNNILLQISFIFYFISIYYLLNNDIEKASLIYLISFIPYYEFEKKYKINQDYNLTFLLINLFIVFIISKKKNFNNLFVFPIIFILLIIFISFSLKCSSNLKKKISKFDNLIHNISSKIYPNDDNTKIYHFNNFWNLFDFSFLTLFIYVLISSL